MISSQGTEIQTLLEGARHGTMDGKVGWGVSSRTHWEPFFWVMLQLCREGLSFRTPGKAKGKAVPGEVRMIAIPAQLLEWVSAQGSCSWRDAECCLPKMCYQAATQSRNCASKPCVLQEPAGRGTAEPGRETPPISSVPLAPLLLKFNHAHRQRGNN